MIRKEGLYLGWRWSQASGAVAGWYSGEATRCWQTRSGEEGDRGRRGTLAPLRRALLCKKNIKLSIQNFGSTSPARRGFQNLQENQQHDGRHPHIYEQHDGRHAQDYIQPHIYNNVTTTPTTPTTTTTTTTATTSNTTTTTTVGHTYWES